MNKSEEQIQDNLTQKNRMASIIEMPSEAVTDYDILFTRSTTLQL